MPRYIDVDKIKFSGESFNDADGDALVSLSNVRRAIDQTPTADVEEILHAEWFPHKVGGNPLWECSNCRTLGSPQWKRCPQCEAKMDGERKEQNDV